MSPYLSNVTDDVEIMICSDKILTLVEPHKSLVDSYLKLRYRMKFYTNVFQIGNSMLVRGYDNGKHFEERVDFHPTFFVPI